MHGIESFLSFPRLRRISSICRESNHSVAFPRRCRSLSIYREFNHSVGFQSSRGRVFSRKAAGRGHLLQDAEEA